MDLQKQKLVLGIPVLTKCQKETKMKTKETNKKKRDLQNAARGSFFLVGYKAVKAKEEMREIKVRLH